MAFSSLFSGLSAIKEDLTEPKQQLHKKRKRQRQGELTGPHNKKQHVHDQFTRLFEASPHVSVAESQRAGVGFTRGGRHHHNYEAAHDLPFKGQDYKTVNVQNGSKQQEWKKKQWQKNQYQQQGRGRPVYRGGGQRGCRASRQGRREWKNTSDREGFQVKRTPLMTPEFMEQNVLNVNGRLICKHFLWGRCLKGENCQMEHIEGYNDLLKGVCKFYVQGVCTKGASCPYMHQSFPCKYFHSTGRCNKDADCRFSHEPLTDVTKELLDKFLIWEQEMNALAKKAEEKSSGQPESTDKSEATEADKQPDILALPLRPNFYKSSDTNYEDAEELSDNKVEEVPSTASDALQLCSAPSVSPQRQEPVCYSVDAVLGAQLSKPFANYFTTPRSQESDTPSSPGYNPPPPSQSASYVPISQSYRSLNSGIQNQKVPASVNVVSRSQESFLKSSPGLDSQICHSLTAATGDQKKQGGNMPESLQTDPRASHEVPVYIPRDTSCVNSKRESFTPSGLTNHRNTFSRPPGETFSSKHLSFLNPALKPSWRPISQFSSSSTEVRHKVAAVTVDPVSTPVKVKEPTDNRNKLSASEGETKQHFSSDTVAESSSKMAPCGESASVCKKPPETPFCSLFSAPITDMPQPLGSSGTCSSSASQSADSRRTPPKAAPDKTPSRSFLGLFSAPLTAAPGDASAASCSQQPAEKATHFSVCEQKTDPETAVPPQPAPEVLQISHEPEPNFPPNPVEKPEQQLSESPSHKAAAPANSVLKTLFLRLSPFREDEEINGASEREQTQHQEKKQKGKKKPKVHNSLKPPTGNTAPSSPGIKGPPVEDPGSNMLPFQPRLKLLPEEGQPANGSVACSTLKDLFKNLDTSISPFRH